MHEDYADDPALLEYLEEAKTELRVFYDSNYANIPSVSKPNHTESPVPSQRQPTKAVNFTARYQRKQRLTVDELDVYLNIQREDYSTCEPLKWWVGRQAQFPNLWRLVRDIFSIPGK